MRILDQNDNELQLENVDYENGYLIEEKLFVKHHEAVEAVEEQGHWETVAEYPNGGKDVEWVVDVEAVEAKDAWDEYEVISRYILYTEAELAAREMAKRETDLPTLLDRLEAQIVYTAMMTSTLLEV